MPAGRVPVVDLAGEHVLMERWEDTHVMRETRRAGRLAENTLERDWAIA